MQWDGMGWDGMNPDVPGKVPVLAGYFSSTVYTFVLESIGWNPPSPDSRSVTSHTHLHIETGGRD